MNLSSQTSPRSTLFIVAGVLLASAATLACGGGESPSGDGDGDGEASGGDSQVASGGSLGTGGESTSGTGGDSGEAVMGHCEPGAFVNGAFLYQNDPCPDWELENPDPSWPADGWISAEAARFELPTVAGQPYAMSDEYLTNYFGTLHFYATDGKCGKVIEKLSSGVTVGEDFACFDANPQGNYEWLVRVSVNTTGSLGGTTFCPNVTCK